jgi:uncharacterized protein (DUF58 family)
LSSTIIETLNKLGSDGVNLSLAELVRYKGLAKQLNLNPASAIKSSMAGAMASSFKGRGMEFDEARHYQPGDDIRSIDWRVTARTGKTHTKLYREERERPVLIYIDCTPAMHFGTQLLCKSVQAAHAAALIAFSAQSRGNKIGCIAFNQHTDIELKPKSTSKHTLSMLNQIVQLHNASVNARGPASNNEATNDESINNNKGSPANAHQASINKLARLAKPGTLVFVISDFNSFDESCFNVLGRMHRHCEIRPLRIFDPIEQALPHIANMQDVLLSDGKNEHYMTLGDNQLEKNYAQARQQWFKYLQSNISKLGLGLRQIDASKPIESQLIATRRGLLLGQFEDAA